MVVCLWQETVCLPQVEYALLVMQASLLLSFLCCAGQMASQQSFDPLAQPDLLAAFTQAKEPSNSWMSFDDNESATAGPFHQSSMASTTFDRASMGAASGQVVICSAHGLLRSLVTA